MGKEFFIVMDVFPLELLACPSFNGLCSKLAKIALFI